MLRACRPDSMKLSLSSSASSRSRALSKPRSRRLASFSGPPIASACRVRALSSSSSALKRNCSSLVGTDPALGRELLPARQLGADHRREIGGRTRRHLGALARQRRLHLVGRKRRVDLAVEPGNDGGGRAGGRQETPPLIE